MSSLKRIGVCFGEEADSIVLLTNRIDTEIDPRGGPKNFSVYGLEEDEGIPYELHWNDNGFGRATLLVGSRKGTYPVTVEVLTIPAQKGEAHA